MNTMISKVSVHELNRRCSVFPQILPNNPDALPWDKTDVSRVMLKFATIRTFDPALSADKIDIYHALRVQYYSDIKLAARAKVVKLKNERLERIQHALWPAALD